MKEGRGIAAVAALIGARRAQALVRKAGCVPTALLRRVLEWRGTRRRAARIMHFCASGERALEQVPAPSAGRPARGYYADG